MEKPLDDKVFTPESTVHLWSKPRKHLNKPSKDELIQELYKAPQLKKLDLRPLNVEDLVGLLTAVSSGIKISGPIPDVSRNKTPYIEYLGCLNLKSISKLSTDSLRGLSEFLTNA